MAFTVTFYKELTQPHTELIFSTQEKGILVLLNSYEELKIDYESLSVALLQIAEDKIERRILKNVAPHPTGFSFDMYSKATAKNSSYRLEVTLGKHVSLSHYFTVSRVPVKFSINDRIIACNPHFASVWLQGQFPFGPNYQLEVQRLDNAQQPLAAHGSYSSNLLKFQFVVPANMIARITLTDGTVFRTVIEHVFLSASVPNHTLVAEALSLADNEDDAESVSVADVVNNNNANDKEIEATHQTSPSQFSAPSPTLSKRGTRMSRRNKDANCQAKPKIKKEAKGKPYSPRASDNNDGSNDNVVVNNNNNNDSRSNENRDAINNGNNYHNNDSGENESNDLSHTQVVSEEIFQYSNHAQTYNELRSEGEESDPLPSESMEVVFNAGGLDEAVEDAIENALNGHWSQCFM